MYALKSVELTDDQSYDAEMPIPMASKPKWPWGLQICLTDAEIEKLGIEPDEAAVDAVFMLHGMARITSVSCNEDDTGKHYRIEAQIEAMDIEGDDTAEEAAEGEAPKGGLTYGKPAA